MLRFTPNGEWTLDPNFEPSGDMEGDIERALSEIPLGVLVGEAHLHYEIGRAYEAWGERSIDHRDLLQRLIAEARRVHGSDFVLSVYSRESVIERGTFTAEEWDEMMHMWDESGDE